MLLTSCSTLVREHKRKSLSCIAKSIERADLLDTIDRFECQSYTCLGVPHLSPPIHPLLISARHESGLSATPCRRQLQAGRSGSGASRLRCV